MFTGLIEDVGRIVAAEASASGRTLTVETVLDGVVPGDSLALSGVCLTATTVNGPRITADVGPETIRVTTLGTIRPGQTMNLERAMRADARVGGHFVQGHVDGVGRVERVWAEGDARWLSVTYPAAARNYLIPKGAITLDGISLTVAVLGTDRFDVMIVPFTWSHTNLSTRQAGDLVNLEFDMIGKYVARAVDLAGLTRQ